MLKAAWLRCLIGTAFASLKKISFGFFSIPTFVGTEPKEAPYVTTGNNLKLQPLITLKLKLVLYLKRLLPFLNLTLMRKCGTAFASLKKITLGFFSIPTLWGPKRKKHLLR